MPSKPTTLRRYSFPTPFGKLLVCPSILEYQILDMMATIKEQSSKLTNRTTTSLCPDISPSSSHFFEVFYIGRIKVSHKKVPDTFIDDALDKFDSLERLKKEKNETHSLNNNDDHTVLNGVDLKKGDAYCSSDGQAESTCDPQPIEGTRKRSGSVGSTLTKKHELFNKDNGIIQPEQNRTMVFHVGRTDLRLISPDRKQVLLHKYLKEITCSVQGMKHPSYLAFICKEVTTEPVTYIAYVFKCQSPGVAEDLVTAISQASVNDKKSNIASCEHCPMVWYHKLCSELEGLNEKAMEDVLNRRLNLLPEAEHAVVQMKLSGVEPPQGGGAKEHIELIMMLLRAHCESKQSRHIHDNIENRHEFLTHFSGGAIFLKAKRSLTSSFDQLLKRRGSKDELGPVLSMSTSNISKDLIQESSHSLTDSPEDPITEEPGTPGSMMNLFMKLGNSPKTPSQDWKSNDSEKPPPRSWRQAIFNTVITPSKALQEKEKQNRKKDKQFYRELWKKAINQTRLLIRMEKENAKLTARQEEANVKRIKLEYEEIGSVDNSDLWDSIITEEKIRDDMIDILAFKGVPKMKRGDIWLHLVKHQSTKTPFNLENFPYFNVPYEHLLKELTSHQHAILIDLGRTFPSHSYFSSPLGPGQLALFNILKAYSLLDPEVGYCQGLSFIAAVLLLHMSEAEAFYLLKHLMFQRGFRARYLPDMTALQVSLYQLSRLMHDHHPQLYTHFDALDIHPALYAAPWLLTLFASQFPLGYVARVFDLLFANSPDILFKIALALIGHHEQNLLNCDSFELVMDYLKNTLPKVNTQTLDRLLKEALNTDISKEINEYGVEYHVLQEEMASPRPETKKIKELEASNQALNQQLSAMSQQLQIEISNKNRLESSRSNYMQQLNRLEADKKSLENSVNTLGLFISEIVDANRDIQVPKEVLKILQEINITSQRRKSLVSQMSAPEFLIKDPVKVIKEEDETKPVEEKSIGRILTEAEKNAIAIRKKREQEVQSKLKSSQSSLEIGIHPLDSNNVPIHFEGTVNLKKIQLQKTRTVASMKNVELKIVEKPSDSVTDKLTLTKNKVTRLFESCNDVFKREENYKPFGQETQLLIKSQAMQKSNGFLT
ncbi:TBC1 domain family member 1 isoform X2 [Cimex lectularius]|uniref:Rab-GAP TBC domain-containing protein n=1 Tax=Cimex lectularius TaxID=79782 RepID=A0A8I6RW69_CIMLE|nr:TBC1 domain family member 1 isoform X2 [Cimex lectularius]